MDAKHYVVTVPGRSEVSTRYLIARAQVGSPCKLLVIAEARTEYDANMIAGELNARAAKPAMTTPEQTTPDRVARAA